MKVTSLKEDKFKILDSKLLTTVAENHKEFKKTVHHKLKECQNPTHFLHSQSRADIRVVYHF